MRPDLTVSVISAGNLELLLPCLRSVFESTHRVSLEVYLVDNASTGGTAAAVEAGLPQVQVLRNEEPQGFSTNNNRVLRRGRGRYLMLLNDDTLVLDGALDILVAFADRHPDAGVVGSFLLNPDRTFQPSFSRFPNPWLEGFWSTAAFFPGVRAGAAGPFETDTVCGAALMIRRQTMEAIGWLDTDFDPIYAEETDWCYRAKQAGWKVFTHPAARIVHYGGQTMNRIPMRRLELLQTHKAKFFRKHHGEFATAFFKTSLWISSLAKFLLYSVPWRGSARAGKAHLHRYMLRRVPRL